MVEIQYLSVEKKARYSYISEINNKKLFIALHGYAYSIETFASNFEFLKKVDFDLLIPEAMHRFYSRGTSGKVVCSWMTNEMRNYDIDENNIYLENLLAKILNEKKYNQIYLLGFSQGGSTALRWISTSKFNFDKIIIWASSIPNEINYERIKNFNSEKKFFIGDKDEYFTENQRNIIIDKFNELGFNTNKFNGTHIIIKELLIQIL